MSWPAEQHTKGLHAGKASYKLTQCAQHVHVKSGERKLGVEVLKKVQIEIKLMKRARRPFFQSREAHGTMTLSDKALMYSMIMHMTCVAANVVPQ